MAILRVFYQFLSSVKTSLSWHYRFEPAAGTAEFELTDYYLKPQDWLTL